MKTLLLILPAVLFLTSCVSQPKLLYKNVSNDEIQQDNADCKLKAMQITEPDYEYRGTFMAGANIKKKQDEAMKLCLMAKGYKEQGI